MHKIIYYESLSDDFANVNVETKDVKKDFKFINNKDVYKRQVINSLH